MTSERKVEVDEACDIQFATSVSVGACDKCDGIHINLIDEHGAIFATAVLPVDLGEAFIADVRHFMTPAALRSPATTVRQ